MIEDALIVWLLFQLILLGFNILGYLKMPWMSFFGLIGTVLVVIPTIEAFDTYYLFATVLIITNVSLPILSIKDAVKQR